MSNFNLKTHLYSEVPANISSINTVIGVDRINIDIMKEVSLHMFPGPGNNPTQKPSPI